MRKADNLPPSCAVVTKSGNLNFLEPSGPLRAVTGLIYLYIYANINDYIVKLIHTSKLTPNLTCSVFHFVSFCIADGKTKYSVMNNSKLFLALNLYSFLLKATIRDLYVISPTRKSTSAVATSGRM